MSYLNIQQLVRETWQQKDSQYPFGFNAGFGRMLAIGRQFGRLAGVIGGGFEEIFRWSDTGEKPVGHAPRNGS